MRCTSNAVRPTSRRRRRRRWPNSGLQLTAGPLWRYMPFAAPPPAPPQLNPSVSQIGGPLPEVHSDEVGLVPASARAALVHAAGVDALLGTIRPEWRAKNLVERVRTLLPVDPSSACQRLLNAAIYDLREKVLVAGIDIAKEAADRFKLPPVTKPEDIQEGYSTTNIIDLAYRIGLLSRPEWRRIRRAYEIRRDLEHEDDQYEAEVEDLLYIFKTSIDVVLSRDPVHLLRKSDVKELIASPHQAVPSSEFLHEYEIAPDSRQRDILELLINTALDSGQPDIIRQNAVELLRIFRGLTKSQVNIQIAVHVQARMGNKRLELVVAKVACAAGILPYLKQRQIREFFCWIRERLEAAGHQWPRFGQHTPVLEELEDVGGLSACPADERRRIVQWLVLCYLGEPGGYGSLGRNRAVFFSDTAAPHIAKLIKDGGVLIGDDLEAASRDSRVRLAVENKHIARRLEELRDLSAGQGLSEGTG